MAGFINPGWGMYTTRVFYGIPRPEDTYPNYNGNREEIFGRKVKPNY
jgi:hypothetical protein